MCESENFKSLKSWVNFFKVSCVIYSYCQTTVKPLCVVILLLSETIHFAIHNVIRPENENFTCGNFDGKSNDIYYFFVLHEINIIALLFISSYCYKFTQ